MATDTKISRPAGDVLLVGELALLFVVTIAARAVHLPTEPIHDELYHLLAARSWLSDGSFGIGGGEYTRGSLYTMFVGIVYSLFDENVTTVRWSSVIVGSAWVIAVFAWCRYKFDRTTAWIAALLFAFAPGAIFLSQYVRFYVLHGLLFWLGAIVLFELTERRFSPLQQALLIACVLLCFAAATHLQLTTVVGATGIAAFLAIRYLPGLVHKAAIDAMLRRMMIGVLVIGVIGFLVLVFSGVAAEIVEIYRWAPAWASKGGVLKYHWMLVEQYPVIWALIPVAVLVAIFERSMAGLYCAAIFCTAVILQSFAGMKAERFIYYAMPFFFILGAILLKKLLRYVNQLVTGILDTAGPPWSGVQRAVRVVVVALVCMFLLISNPAHRATADMLRGRPVDAGGDGNAGYWSRYQADWERAAPGLKALMDGSDAVLSTSELHMLYFAGRVDFELNFSRLSELIEEDWHPGDEFTIDFRTGRPVISSSESMRQVISCFDSGLIVVRADTWPKSTFIPGQTRDTIEALAERLDVADDWGLRVYRWGPAEAEMTPECERVRSLRPAIGVAGEPR